jgi:hypothetical protein
MKFGADYSIIRHIAGGKIMWVTKNYREDAMMRETPAKFERIALQDTIL